MFNPALLQVADSDNRYTLRGGAGRGFRLFASVPCGLSVARPGHCMGPEWSAGGTQFI